MNQMPRAAREEINQLYDRIREQSPGWSTMGQR